jgi:branched-chain amino acid transport system permease protein
MRTTDEGLARRRPMIDLQVILNGVVLGGLYACVAVGFSLVWGVLNIINLLHGSLIVLGAYLAHLAFTALGLHPFLSLPLVAMLLFAFGYLLQRHVLNHVMTEPVLVTLVLTFGLDLLLYNALVLSFTATPRRIVLDLGRIEIADVVLPVDRLAAMLLALALTGLLYCLLRGSRLGRAIVAVRMDRDAAILMGIRPRDVYAVTFGIGALMAGAAGCLIAVVFPFSPGLAETLLGKSFVVCVLGGLGTVPGALAGGLALGLIESVFGVWLGPQNATIIGFAVLLLVLLVRPAGLVGRAGYE